MGLDFTFSENVQRVHGRCGASRDSFVELTFPQRPGDIPLDRVISPDHQTHIVRSGARLSHLSLTGMPEGETGYAILYTRRVHELSEQQIVERSRKFLEAKVPPNMDRREEYIDAMVADRLLHSRMPIGISFQYGMVFENGKATLTENIFVRWVEKSEFEQRLAELRAKLGEGYDGDEIYGLDEWSFELSRETQLRECVRCDLNLRTSSDPQIAQAIEVLDRESNSFARREFLQQIAIDFASQRLLASGSPFAYQAFVDDAARSRFLDFLINEAAADPELKMLFDELTMLRKSFGLPPAVSPGCNKGTSYTHVSAFQKFLNEHGEFPFLLEMLERSEGEVDLEVCKRASGELDRLDHLLRHSTCSALQTLSSDGEVVGTYPYTGDMASGNSVFGYGIRIERDKPYLIVEFKAPSLFSIELTLRRKLLEEGGFGLVMAEVDRLKKEEGELRFTEIWREGDSFVGRTPGGALVDLPKEAVKSTYPKKVVESERAGEEGGVALLIARQVYHHDPFGGFLEREKMERVRVVEVPASESFGFFANLFRKQLGIAQRFGLPIRLA